MKTVGIRDLKENLSRHLRSVKAGERILVTERNREVAIIIPCDTLKKNEDLLALVQRGLVSWTGGRPRGMPRRVVSQGGDVSTAVVEDRR